MYLIVTEIQNNIKSIKELQDEVATMRKDGPQYYSDLLKKEFEAMKNNLVNKQITLCE